MNTPDQRNRLFSTLKYPCTGKKHFLVKRSYEFLITRFLFIVETRLNIFLSGYRAVI